MKDRLYTVNDIAEAYWKAEVINVSGVTLADLNSALLSLGEGPRCPVHYDQIHGREAQELRTGIESIISSSGDKIDHDDPNWRDDLRMLLDEVDARDSLAFIDRNAQ